MSEVKTLAAREALKLVRSGMTLGLGSGSTAALFIQELGAAISRGEVRDIAGIPTSNASEKLARAIGIPIVDFSSREGPDLAIDGADEVDPDLNLIKGLGGALLREKIVEQTAKSLVIIVDESKIVSRLGTRGALPVEVTPFALDQHERFLRTLGAKPVLRKESDGKPFVTDNHNYIFHCTFGDGIDDAPVLARKLADRAGIVEHGLFLGMASSVIVASSNGKVLTRNGKM
jgi:ribose 5-phosphate isomerase A